MDKLLILWTTSDKTTVENMLFMYSENAKTRKWWKEVRVLIWGASTKLVAEDPQIQSGVRNLIEKGVDVIACKACADNLKASEKLEKLGIRVFYVGEEFTSMLKSDWKIITI